MGDVSASAHNESGIDMDELERWLAHNRFLRGFPGAEALPERHSLLACPCEILIPAALETQITEENAAEVTAEMIVEGANGPTTPEAEEILLRRGIPVVPDVPANAGGVIVSYFEWVQDHQRYSWSVEQIRERMASQLASAWNDVEHLARERELDLRTAAQAVGLSRLAEAAKLHGIYP